MTRKRWLFNSNSETHNEKLVHVQDDSIVHTVPLTPAFLSIPNLLSVHFYSTLNPSNIPCPYRETPEATVDRP